ncbi:MAG: hypothetical protein M3Q69_00955 [Acidobacteriota bacterium]|nr:hypothetical protein [Acidobacteriota bacterium]
MTRSPRAVSFVQLTAFAMAFAISTVAAAQAPPTAERILVPISVGRQPGAYGSLWSTELWHRNNSDQPVNVSPLAISDAVYPTHRTVFLPIGVGHPGLLLFMHPGGSDAVQFDLRLFNDNDPQSSWGTKIPVVREREFVHEVSLINVPTSADYRTALRIYGLPEGSVSGDPIHVDIYGIDERLLASTVLPFEGVPRYAAVLSLADAFPEIRRVPRVNVRITSPRPGDKIWAFVSVTANATQYVTLVTPN